MPRGKKATGRAASASAPKPAKQSSLSFGGRVTKPNTSTRSASSKLADSKAAALESTLSSRRASTAEISSAQSSPEPESTSEPTTGVQGVVGGAIADVSTSELAIRAQVSAEDSVPKTEEEVKAGKVTEAQIKKYWADKEAERLTTRVHQEGLSLHEKVLREFDMSAQYGPCMGVARGRRWKLASELGLAPPIEVLGVLLKEEGRVGKGDEAKRAKVQRAYVDELMSSRFVVD